jgi:hypothetical protein
MISLVQRDARASAGKGRAGHQTMNRHSIVASGEATRKGRGEGGLYGRDRRGERERKRAAADSVCRRSALLSPALN